MRILGSVVALFACFSAASSQLSYQHLDKNTHLLPASDVLNKGELNNPSPFKYIKTKSVIIAEESKLEHYALYWRDVKVLNTNLVIRIDDNHTQRIVSGELLLPEMLSSSYLAKAAITAQFPYDDKTLIEKVSKDYEINASEIRNVNKYIAMGDNKTLSPIYNIELLDNRYQRKFINFDAHSLKVVSKYNATASFLSPHSADYHAVATTTGNYKLGLNCHQSPNMATEKCQNTELPQAHPIAQQYYPIAPIVSNLYFRNTEGGAFAEFDGYPMVVKLENGQCVYANNLVETYYGSAQAPYAYECAQGIEESHGISGDPYIYYLSKGAFKSVNDAHFYAGVTAQLFYHHFTSLYPEQIERCPQGGSYCLNVIKQRADAGNIAQSSWDGEYTNYASGFRGSPFPHGSSIDIVSHEIGHAILEWNTGNIISDVDDIGDSDGNRQQRSAFHESFADITAIAVKDHYFSNLLSEPSELNWKNTDVFSKLSSEDEYFWAIGWDARIRNAYSRYVKHPRRDGVSIDDYRDFERVSGSHQRAGAFSKLFYLIATSEGWNVKAAYGLVIKAMTACFTETTGMLEASNCLVEVADDSDKHHIATLAQKVGLIPEAQQESTLNVNIERLYGQVFYKLEDNRLSSDNVARLVLRKGEEVLLNWDQSSEVEWQNVAQGTLTLEEGDHELYWLAELTSGTNLEAYRIANLIDQAICQPEPSTGAYTDSVVVNGESVPVEAGFGHVTLTDSVYSQEPLSIVLSQSLGEASIKAYVDLNRNGYFDGEEITLPSDISDTISLPAQPFGELSQGPVVVRLVLGEQSGTSSCTSETQAQTVDFKFVYQHGQYIAPAIGFEFKQVDQDINFSVVNQYSNAYSFRWLVEGEAIDSREYEFTKQMQQSSEVTLLLLRDGVEVNRIVQQVNVMTEPLFDIQCAQNGTLCRLSLNYENPIAGTTYQWEINGEVIEKDDLAPFEYDFKEYGQYPISVSVSIGNGATQFTYFETISLQEIPTVDVKVTQQDMNFTFSLTEPLPQGYELVWVIDGMEYQYDELGTQISLPSQPSDIQFILRKDGVVVKQQEIQVDYVEDPELQLNCNIQGHTCTFSAQHKDLGVVAKYMWVFGDGNSVTTEEPTVSHTYLESGNFTAQLTLMLNENTVFTTEKELQVGVLTPKYEISSKQHNQVLQLQAKGNVSSNTTFTWFIDSERLVGEIVSFPIGDLGGEYSIRLQVSENGVITEEVEQEVIGYPDIGLDFEWKQQKQNSLSFEFSASQANP
ncbi:PKD domain-containing protein [Pseudoalteromonas luteoviolacea]|uniref:PKD domain-containing protein n=1 Tax=Pseudoalteromonas luteoviolacea TaxID=43657 RepID=UPI00115370C6|nr:PKD domain-containing protein [Pseudoalteromonas luteoviolacea]TQF70993.1 PKD domain-containing protein [Pseudoalteromonas luteoviolacea]